MDMRRRREILAAGHQGYALDRVIDRDREVVARRELLAAEDDIAEYSGLRSLPASLLDPVERAGQGERACQVEPQGKIDTRTQLLGDLFGPEPAASAGINRPGI